MLKACRKLWRVACQQYPEGCLWPKPPSNANDPNILRWKKYLLNRQDLIISWNKLLKISKRMNITLYHRDGNRIIFLKWFISANFLPKWTTDHKDRGIISLNHGSFALKSFILISMDQSRNRWYFVKKRIPRAWWLIVKGIKNAFFMPFTLSLSPASCKKITKSWVG